jgi:hypothetical protein
MIKKKAVKVPTFQPWKSNTALDHVSDEESGPALQFLSYNLPFQLRALIRCEVFQAWCYWGVASWLNVN